ncbi:MAG: M61 family metallopeptidase [Acidobacteriota bacterium]
MSQSPSEPNAEPTVFVLRVPEPEHHRVEVEARVPGRDDGADLELMMATWTPGSYLVREFARHVEDLEAATASGKPLVVEKIAKNRWRVASGGDPVIVRYTLYCHELSVRTNFVEPSFALLNGAPTYLVPADASGPLDGAFEVRLELPERWTRVATALEAAGSGADTAARAFRSPDYATLVDAPIYAGDGRLHRFEVDGVPHRILHHGGEGIWDDEGSVRDAERIVRAMGELWGSLPYRHYLVLNLIVERGGGLEHAESTTLMTSRWKAGTRSGYLDWLGLLSHEVFHAWNVKRLHPAGLGALDLEREVYTRNLWVAEGITSYYDDLMVHRAGLSTREEYLERLSRNVERLQTTPGRQVQPLELASFDAWIKHYRPDENSVNSAVSYYTKGAVVAFLLDVEIRRATGGERSLDDALRLAWERFGPPAGSPGYTREGIREVLLDVAGPAAREGLAGLLERALGTTDELEYGPALEWLGLRFAEKEDAEEPERAGEPSAAWLGAETKVDDGRLRVTRVPRGTPAWTAGVAAGDEILAIGGFRVPPRELDERLKALRPGHDSTLLVARRERLLELPVTFSGEPAETWKLEVDPDATPEQAKHLDAWLGRQATAGPAVDR